MTQKSLINPIISGMKPQGHRGALPHVTTCPYCGISMNQTKHNEHRPVCQLEHRFAPPQPARIDEDAGNGYNANGTYPQT